MENIFIKNCIALPDYTIIVLLSDNTVKNLNFKDEVINGFAKCLKDLNIFLNIHFTKCQLYWGEDPFNSLIDIHIDQII